MPRYKLYARKSTGGKAPRKQLARNRRPSTPRSSDDSQNSQYFREPTSEIACSSCMRYRDHEHLCQARAADFDDLRQAWRGGFISKAKAKRLAKSKQNRPSALPKDNEAKGREKDEKASRALTVKDQGDTNGLDELFNDFEEDRHRAFERLRGAVGDHLKDKNDLNAEQAAEIVKLKKNNEYYRKLVGQLRDDLEKEPHPEAGPSTFGPRGREHDLLPLERHGGPRRDGHPSWRYSVDQDREDEKEQEEEIDNDDDDDDVQLVDAQGRKIPIKSERF